MKKLFRKAVSVLGSVAMVGATVSTAAAAAYPAPFDMGNYAVVYGANSQDSAAANVIASGLPSLGGTDVMLGSDSYKLEKSSDKFNLGDTMSGVVSSTLDDDDMPELLKEGKYVDDDNDEFDYTQSISLEPLQLTMFEDSDYADDQPTLGFEVSSGTRVMSYLIEFTDEPLLTDLATTDIPVMGKNFYILSVGTAAGAPSFTLLDSAVDTVLAEGETTTLNVGGVDYEVSITFISDTEVKLSINGEVTNSLAEGQTMKLNSGVYVGVKDILYVSKDTGVSKVEFSLGGGKLVLSHGSEVELNEDNVNGLVAYITNTSTTLSSVNLTWETDDDEFITDDSELVMPGFGVIKLSMTGIDFPKEEMIEVAAGSDDYIALNDFPLKDSTEDIALLYTTGSSLYAGIGKDADELLLTDLDGNMTFDADLHAYFVASWSDGDEGESYLMRATNFKTENSVNKTTFQYRKDGVWTDATSDRDVGDTFSLGNVEIEVGAVMKDAKTVVIANNSADTSFHELYSASGMKVYLPYSASNSSALGAIDLVQDLGDTVGHNASSFHLTFVEEDKDEDIAQGSTINVTVGFNSQSTPEPTVSSYAVSGTSGTEEEIGDTDVFRNFVYSSLATEILHDKGPDQETLKLVYHDKEVAANVYISSTDVSSTTTSGKKTFMDTESGYSGKNIVVVGGSCINSVAASLLGGDFCGDDFTGATAVGPGEFLIQSFDYSGNVATVVAGYEQEDTAKAASYLNNEGNAVMTDVGSKYKGQTATESAVKVS